MAVKFGSTRVNTTIAVSVASAAVTPSTAAVPTNMTRITRSAADTLVGSSEGHWVHTDRLAVATPRRVITLRSRAGSSKVRSCPIAVGIASVPRYARLVRAQTQVVRGAGSVEAATTLGLGRAAVIGRHVLPNAIKPVLILATIGIGGNITAGAALSFLGFGAPPPAPEWGTMLAIGRNFLANAWWLVAWPALAITFTVISITAIGRELLRRSEGKRL